MYITAYQTDVDIKYGQLSNMLDWCTDNCTDEWGYTVIDSAGEQPGIYSFKFMSEKDYVTFLVWKK